MPITVREFPAIVSSIRSRMTSNIPALDTSEGTFFRIATIDPIASELLYIEDLLLQVQESQSLLTASGIDLDLKAVDYNVFRRGAQNSSGFVQFYIAQASLNTPISIPKGEVVFSNGGIEYVVLLSGVLNGFAQQSTRNSVPTYEITLPIAANVAGVVGNALVGQINSTTIPNISVTNDSPIEGGFDEEPDDSLATRAIESFGIWSRGIKSAVEQGAKLVPGVYYASAVFGYAGHFDIYVADQAGNLSDDMKTAVINILDDWRAAGISFTVKQPPVYLLNVNVVMSFTDPLTIQASINQARSDITSVINATRTNKLYMDDLSDSIRTKTLGYVAHYNIISPTDHVIQADGVIIRAGTIVVTESSV